MNKEVEIARKKEEIHNSLIHMLSYFSILVKGKKINGGAIFRKVTSLAVVIFS